MKEVIITLFVEEFNSTALILNNGQVRIAIMEAGRWITKDEFLTQAKAAHFNEEMINSRLVVFDAIDGEKLKQEYYMNKLISTL